jgi:hypothetical protein
MCEATGEAERGARGEQRKHEVKYDGTKVKIDWRGKSGEGVQEGHGDDEYAKRGGEGR